MRCPVLEIGDEGIHLLVVEAAGAGLLEPLVREERALRIAAAIDRDGVLTGGVADLLTETVRRLAARARDVADGPPRALLTGSVAASADDELIGRIAAAVGSPPRRLLPDEDARLAFAGATVGVGDVRTPMVLLRLRAEHLQLAFGRAGDVVRVTEAELGTDLLIRTSSLEEGLDETAAEALATVIRGRLRAAVASVHDRSGARRLVAGGTLFRHVAAAIATARWGEAPRTVHRMPLSLEELLDARTHFAPDGSLGGTTAPDLPISRGDEPALGTRLAVAAAVVSEVAAALPVDEVTVCVWGAREAVALEAVGAAPASGTGREARRRSVPAQRPFLALPEP